ncbi:hypothetical protein MDA_GLEAN10009603 [Myotis davidii]|uniref:Uncharacterized protein n=1 Tax=Myotis davidii TaxID=225400 RepID=L5M8L2_MYODS|nr:hypothetical protein MDA_GLEAN10009603 [Myotis davidii]
MAEQSLAPRDGGADRWHCLTEPWNLGVNQRGTQAGASQKKKLVLRAFSASGRLGETGASGEAESRLRLMQN